MLPACNEIRRLTPPGAHPEQLGQLRFTNLLSQKTVEFPGFFAAPGQLGQLSRPSAAHFFATDIALAKPARHTDDSAQRSASNPLRDVDRHGADGGWRLSSPKRRNKMP
ncbi:MAG: hypothetical protein HYR84_15275 [Planctomycetes bacterium]|nr:hypothetical protein [Planctomycetota bacterium]